MKKQTDGRIPVTFTTEELEYGLPEQIETAAKVKRMKKAVFLKWLATEFIEGRLAGFYAPLPAAKQKSESKSPTTDNQIELMPKLTNDPRKKLFRVSPKVDTPTSLSWKVYETHSITDIRKTLQKDLDFKKFAADGIIAEVKNMQEGDLLNCGKGCLIERMK